MMKKQQLTPQLRFPEFEGKLKINVLGKYADITKLAGYEYTKHIIYSKIGTIIGLRALNIKNNVVTLDDVQYIDGSDFSKLSRSKLFVGDLLFTYIGANIGDIAIVPENNRFYLAPNISRIRCDEINFHFSYIFQYFRRDIFLQQEIGKYIASSSQPALAMENIRKFKIFFPELPEQQKIASFLTEIDKRIQLLTTQKLKLEEYKKGVMQLIFSQKLRFKDENGKSFPDWDEKKLGEMVDIVKGKQLNKEELTEIGDYPCQNGGINPSGYTDVYNMNENTITISEGGNSCGYVNFMKTKFWCGGHCYALLNLKVHNMFLFQYLQSNQDEIMRLRVGSGLPNIQKGDISSFKIFVPSQVEQQKIASFLSTIDNEIEKNIEQVEKTKLFKKGLLQQMFV